MWMDYERSRDGQDSIHEAPQVPSLPQTQLKAEYDEPHAHRKHYKKYRGTAGHKIIIISPYIEHVREHVQRIHYTYN
jgi:hypothetical protein